MEASDLDTLHGLLTEFRTLLKEEDWDNMDTISVDQVLALIEMRYEDSQED